MSPVGGGQNYTLQYKRFFNLKKTFLEGLHCVPVCVYTMACKHIDTVQLSAIKFLAKVILAISTCHGEMDRIIF